MPINDTNTIAGLLSRARCVQLAQYMISGATPGSIAALWINLDRFQQVNHSFGYSGGNKILSIIADRLELAAGNGVHLGHMGADEFLCLLHTEEHGQAVALAEHIMAALEEPIMLNETKLHPAARIGIALLEPGEDSTSLLQRADQAMHLAKRNGQRWLQAEGDHTAATGSCSILANTELEIESKLHQAIESGGLSLHYQPILRQDGSIDAVEALMRCTVNGRDISPTLFIPVAEKTGLITRLGEWTMTQGALFARRLGEAGYPIKVAVNISRAQLLAPHFSQALSSALIYAELPAERLELELTESLFMDMSATVQENLCDARAAGVSLAIDDFGTGYSCLANLKDIHAAKLKLDRAFAMALPEDARALAIVKAMTRLGQELGMTVVAEGVETRAQMHALLQAGVDAAQGYLFATALPGDDLLAWLEVHKKKHVACVRKLTHDSLIR